MISDEFKTGMERLRGRQLWAGSMDKVFVSFLFPKIKVYSFATFTAVIDDLLAQHNKPTVDDIVKACALKARSLSETTGPKITEIACAYCDSYGVVLMQPAGKHGLAPFTCTRCSNGALQREINSALPTVSDGIKAGWTPERASLRTRYQDEIEASKPTQGREIYANRF